MLIANLRKPAAAELRHASGLDDVSQSSGRVSARFSDGSERGFDVLVGADGLHSRVRAVVQGDRPLRPGRRVAWLAVVRFEHLLIEPGVALTSLGQLKALAGAKGRVIALVP